MFSPLLSAQTLTLDVVSAQDPHVLPEIEQLAEYLYAFERPSTPWKLLNASQKFAYRASAIAARAGYQEAKSRLPKV